MKKYDSILVFDFETSGLDYATERVIELGACYLHRGPEGKENQIIDHLVKVPFKLPAKIVELTHITDEMLAENGILESALFAELQEVIKPNTLLVAYNISFDLSFLTNMFRRYLRDDTFEFDNDILDVMAIYKDRANDHFKCKLCNAIDQYKVTVPNSHRASDDSLATFYVLQAMIKEKDDIDVYINTIGYNPNYPINGLINSHVNYVKQGYESKTKKYYKISE